MAPVDSGWQLVDEGSTLAREHEIESLFAISNGYVGSRASLEEGSVLSSPGTFVAGVFESYPDGIAAPELALMPEWTKLYVWVGDERLTTSNGKLLLNRRILDLQHGLLWREWRHEDSNGRITNFHSLRFASLADRHLLCHCVALIGENYNAKLCVESRLELLGAAQSPPGAAPQPSHARVSMRPPRTLSLRTVGSNVAVWIAASTQFWSLTDESRKETAIEEESFDEDSIITRFCIPAEIGESYNMQRFIRIGASRDEPKTQWDAGRRLQRHVAEGITSALTDHMRAWESRWQTTSIEIEGDEPAQLALRFAAYHLISAANPDDEHVSVGARALTGTAYKGHVFWETEVFMLPFYTHTHPPSARSLLMYRYHTLPAAREKARSLKLRGALFAWESTDSGVETTPEWVVGLDGSPIHVLNGTQEQHISADVAYAVWQYWRATGDEEFLCRAGAEIILETARFWASRGQIESDGQYHIRHVIGPDEYHEDVDDNAYTNLMAQWNLECGVIVASLLQKRWPSKWEELALKLTVRDEELRQWLILARRMYTGLSSDGSKHEQFQGFFGLDHVDLQAMEPRTIPVDVLLGRERVRSAEIVKQADVVMAVCLLWNRFAPELRMANFRYYEPRTAHGSSLSPSMHAAVAGRLGDLRLAEKYFRQAAAIDLANNMGNAAGGVHAGALGGLWQAAVFGIAGVIVHRNGIELRPNLLPSWKKMRFPFIWRNQVVRFDIRQSEVELTVEGEALVRVAIGGCSWATLTPGKLYRSTRAQDGGWQQWAEVQA